MKTWTKTKVQGLMRHKTGTYYARLFMAGKEKWVSLKTHSLEVAKGKMRADEQVNDIREAQGRKEDIRKGKMTVSAAVELYKKHVAHRVILRKIKPSTQEFWNTVLNSIQLSWPDLAESQVCDITAEECKEWFGHFALENSAPYSNNTLGCLKKVFDQAVNEGVIFRNPLGRLERVTVRTPKLDLPSREQYFDIVQRVRQSGHRTAQDAGDTVEFLAYSGCRVGEARRVVWADCDFEGQELTIRGDLDTNTKNWLIRKIPMISSLSKLLLRMKNERSSPKQGDSVLLVGDVRGSLGPVSLAVGAPITHHDLRHLFATTAIESGVDIPTVAMWLGHQDGGALAMKIYSHVRPAHGKASAEKVSFDFVS
jgi:site-specific recombinase XerD